MADLPLFLKVDVTGNDIINAYYAKRQANRSWARSCPISTAITRQLGTTDVITNLGGVSIDGINYEASQAVKDYIKNVDSRIDRTTGGINPQTFYLKRADA